MGKTSSSVKLFLILVLSTAYVIIFSHFGVQAYNLYSTRHNKFPPGTSIATVNIGAKTENEALTLLNKRISEWSKSTKIILQLNDKSQPLDLSLIQFRANETIQHVKDGQSIPVELIFTQNMLRKQLTLWNPKLELTDFDIPKMTEKIAEIASGLQTGKHVIHLENYVLSSSKTIGKADVHPYHVPNDLHTAVSKMKTIEIPGQATFSFLEYAEKQKLQSISSDTMSIIASGIYQAILTSNFSIMEKNTSTDLPNYADPGFEAKVDIQKNNDFVFANPNIQPYTIHLKWKSNGIHVTLKGPKLLSQYKISTDPIQYFSPKTIIQYSPLLRTGQLKVQQAGIRGMLIKVYRKEYQNDQLIHKELMSEDFYPPVHRIEIHPLKERPKSVVNPDLTTTNPTTSGQSGDQTNSGNNSTDQTDQMDSSNNSKNQDQKKAKQKVQKQSSDQTSSNKNSSSS